MKASLILVSLSLVSWVHGQETTAVSPDGKLSIQLAISAEGTLQYRVLFNGQEVIKASRLGLELQNQQPLGSAMKIVSTRPGGADEGYRMPHGKANPIRNHYRSVVADLEETRGGRKLSIELRAFDDAVAFRYLVPAQDRIREARVTAELTEFAIAKEGSAFPLILDGFRTSYEDDYIRVPLGGIKKDALIALPFLTQEPGIAWVAITEADLENYPGMYLNRPDALTLKAKLAPRVDEPGIVAVRETPFASPWRIIMVGEKPGRLIESNAVLNLSPASKIGDDSWVKPGKAAWNWWSGGIAKNVSFQTGMNTATMEHYVDFAAEAGLEYMLIDAGWSATVPGTRQADITNVRPEVDLAEIVRHASEKKIGIWLWAHWTSVDRQMDEAFPLFEKWGIKGVKIDFMDRDDQWMVEFYRRVARKAAEHHLMIDFHGAFKPTGLRREYPNVMTHEGVMGLEYLKWSARVTPDHNVTIPFTRMLAGPMDYTPGGFTNVTAAEFQPRGREPMTLGTRAHQMALYVVLESGFTMVSDYPEAYRGEKELDFISRVPNAWDETRVLEGEPGKFIAIARRKGNEWYVGCLTGSSEARVLQVPLDFLPSGKLYQAEIYADAPDAGQFPKKTVKQERAVRGSDLLKVEMAPGGGQAIRIWPAAGVAATRK